MVTREHYREAMARLGAAVSIVATDGPAGRAGFTASAVCSVTDTPPTLLVCMNRGGSSGAAVKGNGVLCVNVLAAGQEHLSARFGGRSSPAERFAEGEWTTLATGAPVLAGTVASFDCTIAQATEVGTHTVLFCEVEAVRVGDTTEGLIYFGRRYHRLVVPA